MAEQAAGLNASPVAPDAIANPGGDGRELRRLFDAVCDLPPAQWRDALRRLGGDPAVVAEVLALLEAQTISFNRALQPLGELMASLPDAELRVGDRLGAWQLVECLASGGMGTVFVAERADQLFRQRVAIKLLRGIAGDPGIAHRLAEERQILAELQHPNIARLFDGGTTPSGHPYLVMEYIAGLPLDRHCRQRGLGLRARLDMYLRVCRAVQAAHQRLVVHCDLKPSNILVRDEVAPVLLDFGIAQVLGHGGGDPQAFCTPAYASPEQLAGGRVGMASDVFSLGVLLVELLADRRAERTAADHHRPVPAPSALAGAGCAWRRPLRGDLDAIAARACALDPALRYPSVEALVRDIERHLAHRTVAARAPTLRYRFGRWLRRNWRGAAASALLVLLTAGFVWRLVEERARAEHEAVVAQQVSDFLVATFDAADPRLLGASGTDQVTARQVLDAGAARIAEEAIDDPAVLARLRYVIGRSYSNLGQSERAEALLEQSVEGFLARGVDRPDQAVLALDDLVALQTNQRRGQEAVATARRALTLASRLGDPASIASAHSALGSALRVEGEFDEAQRALDVALEMRRALFGDRAGKTNDIRHNLAVLYKERGEPARAERAYRDVIRYMPSRRSWDYQVSLAGLASAVRQQGRYAEAAGLLRDNLALARELYGEDSDRVAKANADLAAAYRDAGDYLPAHGHYRKAVDISRRLNGEDSAGHAIQLNGLASIEEARGDLAAAERTYRQSLAIRRKLYPPGDNSVLIVEANLGHVLADMGRLDEARPLLQHALQGWRELDHPNAVPGALNWVEWLLRADRLDEAATDLAAIPEPDRNKAANTVQYLAAAARLATQRGRADEAVPGWEQLVAVSTAQAGADSVPTAKWRVPYAEALRAAGETAAARAQLDRAEPWLRRALVADAELLRRIDALRRNLSAGSASG